MSQSCAQEGTPPGEKDSLSFADHNFNCSILKCSAIGRNLRMTWLIKQLIVMRLKIQVAPVMRAKLRQSPAWGAQGCQCVDPQMACPTSWAQKTLHTFSNSTSLWRIQILQMNHKATLHQVVHRIKHLRVCIRQRATKANFTSEPTIQIKRNHEEKQDYVKLMVNLEREVIQGL